MQSLCPRLTSFSEPQLFIFTGNQRPAVGLLNPLPGGLAKFLHGLVAEPLGFFNQAPQAALFLVPVKSSPAGDFLVEGDFVKEIQFGAAQAFKQGWIGSAD